MRRLTSTLAVPLLLVGCADGPDVAEPTVSLQLLAEVDEDATPERTPFGAVVDVELAVDGTLYVLDGLSRTISVFDSGGAPLRTFAARGRGPGELERPEGMLWGPDERLWVLDSGTGRITAFDLDGELAATYPAPGPQPYLPMAAKAVDASTLRVVGLDFMSGSLERPSAVLADYRVADGAVAPERQTDLPFVEWPDLYRHATDDVTLLLAVPFSPEPMFAIDPSGALWYGEAGPGRVRRWTAGGTFDRSVGRDLPPIPVAPDELEAVLADDPDVEELRQLAGPSGYAEFLARIPDTRPHLQAVFFGDDGALWIMRTAQTSGSGAPPLDRYDERGELLGTTETRLSAVPRPRIRNGRIAGVVRDELGVESVALYRVVR